MADEPVLATKEELDELERQIERLRVLYQQYFMGSLKTEPLVLRTQIYTRILKAKPQNISNTGTRFRLRNLIQKWNGYLTMWKRIARQMEEGTYRPDLERARRHHRDDNPAGEASGQPPVADGEDAGVVTQIAEEMSDEELERQLHLAIADEVSQHARAAADPRAETPNTAANEEALARLIMERQGAGMLLEDLDLETLRRG